MRQEAVGALVFTVLVAACSSSDEVFTPADAGGEASDVASGADSVRDAAVDMAETNADVVSPADVVDSETSDTGEGDVAVDASVADGGDVPVDSPPFDTLPPDVPPAPFDGRCLSLGGLDAPLGDDVPAERPPLGPAVAGWTNLTPCPTPAPWPLETAVALLYDPLRDRLYGFGGKKPVSGTTNDVWIWNQTGLFWSIASPCGGTKPTSTRAFFDTKRDRLVAYGDTGASGPAKSWEWNPGDHAWAERDVPEPGPLKWGEFVFDEGRGLALFVADDAETWEFDPETLAWTNVTPATRPMLWLPVSGYRNLVYDAGIGRVVSMTNDGNRWSIWVWEPSARAWLDYTPAPLPSAWPEKSVQGGIEYDRTRDRIFLFDFQKRRAWEWCWTSRTFTSRTPDVLPPTWPPPMAMPDFPFTGVGRRGRPLVVQNHELWEWHGEDGTWVNLTSQPLRRSWPWPVSGASAAYDSKRMRVVMFGGGTTPWDTSNEVWEWDVVAGTWSNRTPGTLPTLWPTGRNRASMAFDAKRGIVLMAGGETSDPGSGGIDMWEWDGNTGTWDRRDLGSPPDGTVPGGRVGHSLTYDDKRDRVTLFAGSGGYADLWEWDPVTATWANRTPSPLPAAWPSQRGQHAATYDPARDRMVVFGGYAGSGIYLGDVWEWNAATQTWTERTAAGPLPQAEGRLVPDTVDGGLLLLTGWASAPLQELWRWNGTTGSWAKVVDAAGAAAWPTGNSAVAFLPSRSALWVYDGSRESLVNDVWEWHK